MSLEQFEPAGPLPPLDEQQQIVAEVERRLSVIEELEATVEANLTRADRLRQSILSNVFAGKLVCANTNQSGEQSADIQMAKSRRIITCSQKDLPHEREFKN